MNNRKKLNVFNLHNEWTKSIVNQQRGGGRIKFKRKHKGGKYFKDDVSDEVLSPLPSDDIETHENPPIGEVLSPLPSDDIETHENPPIGEVLSPFPSDDSETDESQEIGSLEDDIKQVEEEMDKLEENVEKNMEAMKDDLSRQINELKALIDYSDGNDAPLPESDTSEQSESQEDK